MTVHSNSYLVAAAHVTFKNSAIKCSKYEV